MSANNANPILRRLGIKGEGADGHLEMSSSVLPAALRRRKMGLADGLDIGSLVVLSYGISHARKELTSSVG